MIRPIIKWPHPLLSQVAERFDRMDVNHHDAAKDLWDTFAVTPGARGLAAVQIGAMVRAIILRRDNGERLLMCNPELEKASAVHKTLEEGCLSFPSDMLVRVSRPISGVVAWQAEDGTPQSRRFLEMDLRCILHEIDHLDGITIKHHADRQRGQP